MKKITLCALFALVSSTAFAVLAEQTDIPFAYGEQLKNSTFDGAWNSDNEPSDNSWHSFATASNSGAGTGAAIVNTQSGSSIDIRPGATIGGKSARVSSRGIWIVVKTIIANGNFTTGRIHAGSTTPTDVTGNYTRTVTSDTKYSTQFTSKPDSVSVWIKLSTNNDTNTGRISVVLHGDTDCKDPLSDPNHRGLVAGIAEKSFTRNGTVWQRLSFPVKYAGETYSSYSDFSKCSGTTNYIIPNVDPKYILVTATTNNYPGGGNQNDVLLIDDILMIYNPTLTIGTLSGSSYAKSGNITVPYTLEGTMSPYNSLEAKNKVILQLSDANGSFDNPTVLNEVETDFGGEISGTLPYTITDGTGYRVRIVTTNYPMISADNGFDISISTASNIAAITPTVTLSPNPAQGVVEITNFDILQAEIFNLQGQSLSAVSAAGNNRIDVSTLPVGSYILQLKGRDGQTVRTKLLINR